MRPDFEKVSHAVVRQSEHIEIFKQTSNKETLAQYLAEELNELIEVIESGSEDEMSLLSEIGDVQYLLIRLSEMCGIDLIEATLAKMARNYKKYGDQPDRETAREQWGNKDGNFLNKWTTTYREKQFKKQLLPD